MLGLLLRDFLLYPSVYLSLTGFFVVVMTAVVGVFAFSVMFLVGIVIVVVMVGRFCTELLISVVVQLELSGVLTSITGSHSLSTFAVPLLSVLMELALWTSEGILTSTEISCICFTGNLCICLFWIVFFFAQSSFHFC